MSEHIKNAFEILHSTVMEINPQISYVDTKLYRSYKMLDKKAFLSVERQKSVLKLCMNLEQEDLYKDYKNVLRDVSNIGHWGIGDFEGRIENIEDINYLEILLIFRLNALWILDF